MQLQNANGKSIPIEINAEDNISEFVYSVNWLKSFKEGYWDLLSPSDIGSNTTVVNTTPNNTAKETMYCSKCGKEITKESTFCNGCGNKVEEMVNNTNEVISSNTSSNRPPEIDTGTSDNTPNIKRALFSAGAFIVIMIIFYNFIFGGGVSTLEGKYKPNTSAGDIYTLTIKNGTATISEEVGGTLATYKVKKKFMSSEFYFESNNQEVYTASYSKDSYMITVRGKSNSMFGSLSIWNKQ